MSPSKASKHEETEKHIHMVRKRFNDPNRKRNADIALEDEDELTAAHALEDIPPNQPSIPDTGALSLSWDQYLEEQEFNSTIIGPCLSTDPPDAIYDDYGGELAHLGSSIPYEAPEDPKDLEDASQFRNPSLLDDPFELAATLLRRTNAPAPPIPPKPPAPDEWAPWEEEMSCLTTVLSAFPRAVFSTAEIQIIQWFTEKLGVASATSLDELRECRTHISETFGSKPSLKTSKIGNIYSHNSLKTIIAHEIANPITRSRLSVFPEDAGPYSSNATHGTKWRKEVKAEFASPMARIYTGNSYQDYFVNEPALALVDDIVVPLLITRWIKKSDSLVAQAHRLVPLSDRGGYAVDGRECFEVQESELLVALPDFRVVHKEYDLPSPEHILALWQDGEPSHEVPWMEPVENPWRARAGGKEVIAVPIMGYCDDTSGNLSKKWNKHNSYLFVLAGLPQEDTHSPFHVHFLATSNIASPLEMLEAITKEAEEAAREGVWAYDAIKHDMVLAIVWWLALQGDNPMQTCKKDKKDKKDKKQSRDEAEAEEKSHIGQFMSIGQPRSQAKTQESLHSQLKEFSDKRFTASDELATSTGVKDKYLDHFIATMKATYNQVAASRRITTRDGQRLIAELRENLPERLFNPALYLPGIDVNQDTPVEILHVVLLGVAKYLWRDAVSRLNNASRGVLIARLNSLDVSGLGIAPLRGKTLVQYAGSLTGANFRDILQIAPAVLFDLLDPRLFAMWMELCRLAPIVFQPEIHNIDAYIAELEARIDRLLIATVICNPRWFNKPKFHVLLHLPGHVRRIGPPVLFATETFEGYNFVIRLRSVHSNRQSPSADIGASFSLMHAIRHLVCGGYFQQSKSNATGSTAAASWIQAGPQVLALMQDEIFLKHMGMSFLLKECKDAWEQTQAAKLCPLAPNQAGKGYVSCSSISLPDGSSVKLGGFALVQPVPAEVNETLVLARVEEIVASATSREIIAVVAQSYRTGPDIEPYHFPSVRSNNQPAFLAEVSSINTPVSVFHNCAAHRCAVTATRQRRQERQVLDAFDNEVQHNIEPQDLVLNLAQFRSAETIASLFPHSPPPQPSVEDAITDGIHHQQALEEAAQAEKLAKEAAENERQAKREEEQAKKEERKAKKAEQQAKRGGRGSKRARKR
ncbi:hypothetical protein FRC09_008684 [Ceratobasidium sp. 395]|nr:hypothetical protein FRC09_008684 [Ceratobasidium sp. 395]